MEDSKVERMAELIKVLAQPTRLKIVFLLSQQGETNVSQLVRQTAANQSLISRHLTLMSDKGIIRGKRRGKEVYYSLNDGVFIEWIAVTLAAGQKHNRVL